MRKALPLLALVAWLLVLIVAPTAAADDTTCTGTVTGTHDNVVVPPGQTCTVSAAAVLGSVKALQDSRLLILGSNIRGNVEGDRADIVQVVNSTVRGNVIIKEGGPAAFPIPPAFLFCSGVPNSPCEALVLNSTVEEGNGQIEKMQGDVVVRNTGMLSLLPMRGNIQVTDNFIGTASEFLSVDSNSVLQNVQVMKNTGPGRKFVVANTVRESLQCFENDPPFFGTGNVAREAQGQCSAAPLPMAFGAGAAMRPAILTTR